MLSISDYVIKVGKRTFRTIRGNVYWVTEEDDEYWLWNDLPHHEIGGEHPGRVDMFESRDVAVSEAKRVAQLNTPSVLHVGGREIFYDD